MIKSFEIPSSYVRYFIEGCYCTTSTIHPMTSPFPHFDIKTTTSIFQRDGGKFDEIIDFAS